MSKEAERVFLTNKMVASLGSYTFPIAMPNQEFDIPKNAPYGEFHIISGPNSEVVAGHGKGKALVRYVGFVQLTVWIPKSKGTTDGTKAEDIFKDIYSLKLGRDNAGSIYRFGPVSDFTPQTKEGWTCAVFRVPFERDTVEDVQVSI